MTKPTAHRIASAATLTGLFILTPGSLRAEETPAVTQLTLKQCVEMAIRQSEELQMSAEEMVQARERIRRTTGALLPNLKWNLSEIIQDTSGVDTGSGGVGGTLTKRSRTETKFILKQPLFSGFKEFNARAGFKADVEKFRYEFDRLEIDLFARTAEAFFNVVFLETQRKDLQTLIKLTMERVSELKERVSLGKSRPSEVIGAESQLASLKAQGVGLEGKIDSSREDLSFLIGRNAGDALLVDVTPPPAAVDDEDDTFLLIKNRSDIQALQEDVIAKRFAVKVAKGGFWPKADATGNYYTHRTGFQEEIDWDLTVNLDVPLFQGGGVSAEKREAASRLRQAELELERLTRRVGTEIRQARLNLNSSINESKMLEDAFTKARRSYEMQAKEYRLGLVNNLEVLQAMNSMQQAKEKLDQSLLQSKLNWLRFQIALEEEL